MSKLHAQPHPASSRRIPRRDSVLRIQRDVVACGRCPRLRAWCEQVARTKRRAYRNEQYWGRPVPGFGDPRAPLWIVGLAPAAHGANRTGRMFTGDSSGDWLFSALHAVGFASQPNAVAADDGLRLKDAYIGAVARCAPPDNKPNRDEIDACNEYLARELAALKRLRVVLCLGQVAYVTVLRLLEAQGSGIPKPRPRFAHRAELELTHPKNASPLTLVCSYHPSRQNTQTGRLTRRMWNRVFQQVRARVDVS